MSIQQRILEQQRQEHWASLTLWQKAKFRIAQALFVALAIAIIVGLYLLDKFRWGL